ncbi:hypothetical protein LCGC14_1545600, partial [marine sediment metagenome]
MQTRRYKDIGITISTIPANTVFTVETATDTLYYVNIALDDIYKTDDKGATNSQIYNGSNKIVSLWLDRDNELLYFLEWVLVGGGVGNVIAKYIDLSNDNITTIGTYDNTGADNLIDTADILLASSGLIFLIVTGADNVRIVHWGGAAWVEDDQYAGASDPPIGFATKISDTVFYFMIEDGGVEGRMMSYNHGTTTLTALTSDPNGIFPALGLRGITYDGSNIFSMVLDDSGTNTLFKFNISGNSFTELSTYNIALQLDRFNIGTVPNEFEKAFGVSNEIVYEIKPNRGGVVQLQDISALSDANIKVITDNFVINIEGDIFEFTDVSSEIDEIEYTNGIIGIPQVGFFIAHPDHQANWNKGNSIKIYDQFDILEFWGIIKDKNRDDRGFYKFDIDAFSNEIYRVQYDNDYSADDLDTKQKDIIDNACDFCYRSSSIVGTTTTFDYKYKRAIAYLFYLGRFLERQIPFIEPDGLIHTEAHDGQTKQAQFYGATHNFKDDTDGAEPTGWTIVDGTNCETTIISSLDGHRKVLQLYDNNAVDQSCFATSPTWTAVADDPLEYWVRIDTITSNRFYLTVYEGATELMIVFISTDDLRYYDGANKDIKLNCIVANTWHHIKIIPDDSANTYDVYFDGILEGNDLAYINNSTTGYTGIRFNTRGGEALTGWVDAIGRGSDPAYTVGDNSVGWELSNHWQNAHFIDIPDIRDIQPGYFEGNTGITRATVRYKDNTLSTKPTIPSSGETEEEQLKGILPLEEFGDPKIEGSTEADQIATNLHAIFSLDTVYLTLFVEGQGFMQPGRTLEIQSSDQITVAKNDYVILQYTRDPKNDRYYNIILSDNIVLPTEFKTLHDTSPKQLRTALVRSFENQANMNLGYATEDADLTFIFGRALIDSRFATMMTISNRAMSTQDQYAFGQTSSGSTYINAPTGQLIHLHINDIMKMS